jgi:hypothetical protein
MFWWQERFFEVPISSSKDEFFEYSDANTGDLLLLAWYMTHEIDVVERTRPGCPDLKMPYITRGGLFSWIKMQVGLDPIRSHLLYP